MGCKFTATCSGYIQYTICTRINGEKEEPITFRSTEEFEVHITGDKSLFEPLPVELTDALKNQNWNNWSSLLHELNIDCNPDPKPNLTAPSICIPATNENEETDEDNIKHLFWKFVIFVLFYCRTCFVNYCIMEIFRYEFTSLVIMLVYVCPEIFRYLYTQP